MFDRRLIWMKMRKQYDASELKNNFLNSEQFGGFKLEDLNKECNLPINPIDFLPITHECVKSLPNVRIYKEEQVFSWWRFKKSLTCKDNPFEIEREDAGIVLVQGSFKEYNSPELEKCINIFFEKVMGEVVLPAGSYEYWETKESSLGFVVPPMDKKLSYTPKDTIDTKYSFTDEKIPCPLGLEETLHEVFNSQPGGIRSYNQLCKDTKKWHSYLGEIDPEGCNLCMKNGYFCYKAGVEFCKLLYNMLKVTCFMVGRSFPPPINLLYQIFCKLAAYRHYRDCLRETKNRLIRQLLYNCVGDERQEGGPNGPCKYLYTWDTIIPGYVEIFGPIYFAPIPLIRVIIPFAAMDIPWIDFTTT